MEDLGAIFAVLAMMVTTNSKSLKTCQIHLFKIMEHGGGMAMTVFGFRSTFNEGTVRIL